MTRQLVRKPILIPPAAPVRSARREPEAAVVNPAAPPVHGPRDFAAIPLYPQAPIQRKKSPADDDQRGHLPSIVNQTLDQASEPALAEPAVAPGQERLVPHEAWHVMQQTAGRTGQQEEDE